MKYYEYCSACNHREIREAKELPRAIKAGTDGYGQPVRFIYCDCGKFKGYLELGHYTRQGLEIDDGLLSYLRHRIDFYIEGINN